MPRQPGPAPASRKVAFNMARANRARLGAVLDELAASPDAVRQPDLNDALAAVLDWWDERAAVSLAMKTLAEGTFDRAGLDRTDDKART